MATTASHSTSSSLSSSSSSTHFPDVSQAQDHFAAQFNLADPVDAVSSYARIMHDHTLRQMERARSASTRRRCPPSASVDAMASLAQESSVGSTDSRGSA
ncbi:hypothetical protein MMC34_002153 [Xylographa carneopallida]|nr:hypothetical protein [Xylographa carneopallida]